MTRGRREENFFPNLGINFSSLEWHHLLAILTSPEGQIDPTVSEDGQELFEEHICYWEQGIVIAGGRRLCGNLLQKAFWLSSAE